MKSASLCCLLVAATIAVNSPACADTVQLYPDADTFISSNYPDNNYGGSTALLVGKPSGGGNQHARIRFSGIPSGATMNSATLRLYRYTGIGAFTLAVQSASRSWSENTLTWNTSGSTNRWTTPEATYYMSNITGYLSVDVTAHVQQWADGTRSNYGFHLSANDEWTVDPGNQRGFYSREYSSTSYRPRLEIVYTTAAQSATIWDAWWSNEVDENGDGYVRSARLNWDPDVVGCSGSLSVYEKIYWKYRTSSTWNLITTTSPHTITDCATSDIQYRNINGGSHNEYDWKIEIYRNGESSPDYTRDPSNDSDLNDYAMETAIEDTPTPVPTITSISPAIASAGTDTQVTIIGTNFGASQGTSKVEFFYRSGQPKIEAPVVSWSDTQIVCIVPIDTVSGYPASAGSGPVTVTTSNGTSNGHIFRVTFSYGGMKWVSLLGPPLVGYRINENTSDCTGEGAAVQAAANTWNNAGASFGFRYDGTHANTTSSFNFSDEIMWGTTTLPGAIAEATYWSSLGVILECDVVFNDSLSWDTSGSPSSSEYDVQSIGTHELGHWLNLRDLYGDIGDGEYDSGKIMYGFGSSGVAKRDLHADDADGIRWIYGASSLVATIWNAWWSNEVDQDGDGYVRSARLNWDPDVAGGTGSLTVFEKIYRKIHYNSTWNLITTTSPHTITDTSTSDIQYEDYDGASHEEFDWKIEVYRTGIPSPDYTQDPSNDGDLDDYKMETAAEDCVLPSIPTNVEASDGTYCGFVRVTWNPVSGASEYRVYRDGLLVGSVSGTSFDDVPGDCIPHDYQVKAR
ncbi:MAG: DNRLRE domain-containing protein, partial [Planctomycetota bacterium]